jgi:hypothetical protein
LAWRVEDLFGRIAGDDAPSATLGAGDDPARRRCREAWETWWKTKGARVDLTALDWEDALLGLTVDCEVDGVGQFPGRVCAFGRDGKVRWRVEKLDSPADVQLLPGGRILVAESWAQRITERDRTGKVLWERKLDDKPVAAERLPNGNTLIGTYTTLLEITPEGKTVFSHKQNGDGMIYSVQKLRNGNVLYITSSGKVTELDMADKEVRSFTPAAHANGAAYWASVEALTDGRYLISLSGTGKVVETDVSGKILWEADVPTSTWAIRLRNGNTLVGNCDGKQLLELNREGKVVWKQSTEGRPFRVRRY